MVTEKDKKILLDAARKFLEIVYGYMLKYFCMWIMFWVTLKLILRRGL